MKNSLFALSISFFLPSAFLWASSDDSILHQNESQFNLPQSNIPKTIALPDLESIISQSKTSLPPSYLLETTAIERHIKKRSMNFAWKTALQLQSHSTLFTFFLQKIILPSKELERILYLGEVFSSDNSFFHENFINKVLEIFDPRPENFSQVMDDVFLSAAKEGRIEIMRQLLHIPRYTPSQAFLDGALIYAFIHKNMDVVAFLEQPFQKGDGTSILPSSRTLRLLQQLSTLFPKRLSKTSSFPSLHPIRVRVVEKTSISHTNPPEEFSFIHYLCCGLI